MQPFGLYNAYIIIIRYGREVIIERTTIISHLTGASASETIHTGDEQRFIGLSAGRPSRRTLAARENRPSPTWRADTILRARAAQFLPNGTAVLERAFRRPADGTDGRKMSKALFARAIYASTADVFGRVRREERPESAVAAARSSQRQRQQLLYYCADDLGKQFS